MGQSQSSGDGAGGEEAPARADYYDLLGVERTATEDEIKKAYRRKALELHPDRNYDNVADATRLFAEVQTAYQVLSDPQERAWYDSHRDVLLRGDGPATNGDEFSYNLRMTTATEVTQMMMKFSARMEYSSSPTGFYGGLSDFFEKLAKEENGASQWEDEDPFDYPAFGHRDDDYEDVVRPFYAAWAGFATKKSYAWKDHYRLSDAPDRRIRRLMEKDNKKLRDEGVQEYNDAVRSLIAFVRKRDPRVQENQKSEAERQKILREAAAAQAARSRAARQAKFQDSGIPAVPEWAQSRNKDQYEGGFSSESETEDHEYECVVCDKTFKSEAQYAAHEKSKKHTKLLKQLKREMKEEDGDLNVSDQPAAEVDKADLEDEQRENDHVGEVADDVSVEEDNVEARRAQEPTQVQQPAKNTPDEADTMSEASDDDYASRETIEKRLAGEKAQDLKGRVAEIDLDDTPATSEMEGTPKAKIGKAKLRRAKKAAQQVGSEGTATPTSELQCAVCNADFASKTKLFSHIKEKNHAAPLSETRGSKGGKGKKR